MRSRGPISADERHSYDEEEIGARPAASGDERVGGLRERKREIEKSSWSESPPQSSSDSRSPKGSAGPSCLAGPARSCSILPRASCRCTCRRNAVDALAAHDPCRRRSSSPACTRPASLLLPPAPSPTDPPLSAYSLLLSLSVLRKHLHCFTLSMLQAGTRVARAHATHTHA